MLNPGGYPNSFTHISPTGPCTLTIDWLYPHDPLGLRQTHPGADSTNAHDTSARTTAYLTGSPFDLDGLTYHAHAWTDLNHDLTFGDVHTYMKLERDKPEGPAAPENHHAHWRQHATTVLTELLTPENHLALHRADTHHRLTHAKLDVSTWARNLDKARETLRRTDVLFAVLDLDDPAQRAIGLRLAPTWHGTPDELLAVITGLAHTDS